MVEKKPKKKIPKGGARKRGLSAKNALLAEQAATHYIYDPQGMTLHELRKDIRFCKIPYGTIKAWCTEQDWNGRRQSYFKHMAAKARTELGDRVNRALLEEYNDLLGVRDDLLGDISVTPAKTKEAAVDAALKVFRRLDELRGHINGTLHTGISDMQEAQTKTPQVRPEFTREEIQAATRAVLAERRDGLRQKLARDQATEEPRQGLVIVEGSG